MKGPYRTSIEGGSMSSREDPLAPGLYTDETDVLFVERMKEPHGIAPSSYTGHQNIRKAAFFVHHLPFDLFSDARLKIPDDHGVRMRADHRAQEVVTIMHMGHPIP